MSKPLITALKIVFASAMVIALAVWVQREYGWINTLSAWQSVPLPTIGLAAVAVLVSHFLRVIRIHFAYRLRQPVAFKSVCAVSFVHNTVSFLLPMRLGELALPLLSKHQLEIDYRYSAATLLVARLMDAHVLLCLLVFFAGDLWLDEYALVLPLLLIAALPVGMKLLSFAASRYHKLAFASPLLGHNRNWLIVYGYTLSIWVVKLFALAVVASTLGDIPLTHAWIATILADGSALSPITGFANAGVFEVAFATPLVPLGHAWEFLLQLAVNVHIFIFVTNILVGIAGFVMLGAHKR